ncbi:MAG: metallophosphoesterase [Acidobacteriota bacterium]|nr:metallophosphoesterase [Acidobacteriota bacterium]
MPGTSSPATAEPAATGGNSRHTPAGDGSTLRRTWVDADGDGRLQPGAGEPLVDRTRLGEPEPLTRELARFAHITDAHVLDASSPARVPFLARFGPPLHSTFRPQEALTAQVLHGAINAVRAQRPQLVIQGGDLIDNAQHNELEQALALLGGGRVAPGSGPDGYFGVQLARNPDAFYYRPEIDPPRHPGLLERAVTSFTSPGVGTDWLPVLGDHDALVGGELVPSAVTQRLATGDRALWEMPANLRLPPGLELSSTALADGPDPSVVEAFVEQALAGPTVRVPPDRRRGELLFAELIARQWDASHAAAQPLQSGGAAASPPPLLDYVRDLGDGLRVIVLDLIRRGGGSSGLVHADQPAWLERQLASAADRWVILVTHQPLEDVTGAAPLLELLDRSPRVVAALAGHTHRNRIIPRETPAGGYWLITTCSLIDFPQQCRALRLCATPGGGVALETWMLDHVQVGPLGPISRELAYLDAGAGRAGHLTGTIRDRNARLFRRAPS